jgi:tRNA uridine 5-carbamoylmethylation protein Kti12
MKTKKILIMGLAIFSTLSAVYIYQVNSMTALAHHIAKSQDEIEHLRNISKELEIDYVRDASFTSLEELAAVLQFEKTARVIYSRVGTKSVAQGD